MQFELQPLTEPGRRFVALAESHVADLDERAALHDKEGSFPTEHLEAFKASGFVGGCVPADLGGLGVTAIHDVAAATNRLGRGDGSTAIAATMHTTYTFLIARRWAAAVAAGDAERTDGIGRLLAAAGRGEAIFCAMATEPGTDLLHPRATAMRTNGGWRLNGRKSFSTMSGAATLGGATFCLTDEHGVAQIGFALVPLDREGVAVQHNWDALGMRASGSHDVVLTDVFLREDEVVLEGLYGEYAEDFVAGNLLINVGLLGCFLGIAEAARDHVVSLVTSRRGRGGRLLAESPAVQHTIAEIEIDLAASRAMLAWSALAADAFCATYPSGSAPLAEVHALNKEFQCAKWVVNRKAIEVVDQALQLSGGSGYLSRSPLSRLYRDVRAGPFMQPFSPNEAFQYIGKVTLGLDPRIE